MSDKPRQYELGGLRDAFAVEHLEEQLAAAVEIANSAQGDERLVAFAEVKKLRRLLGLEDSR